MNINCYTFLSRTVAEKKNTIGLVLVLVSSVKKSIISETESLQDKVKHHK